MELVRQEIRYAVRILARNPLFAVVAILTLALGIGANSAIFSAVYSVLLKPLPYKDPDKLVMVLSTRKDGSFMTLSPADLQDYSKSGAFEQTVAYTTETLDLTGKGEAERLPTGFVSWNFFQTFGVQPAFGRVFLESEGKYGAEKVVILSYGLWKRRFASDPRIIGQAVMLSGVPRTVVGIAPPGFEFPSKMQLWSVLAFSPDEVSDSQRGAHWIVAIGRLAAGVTIQQANTRVRAVAAELAKRFPRSNQDVGGSVQPFHGFIVRKSKTALLVLWASVGFVLLIACVNVTNLLLAQAARRESEVAIRMALGAGRMRLFRQFLIESLVLAFAASLIGILIGLWCTELLVRFGSASVPALAQLKLDSSVLVFTLSVSLLTGILIGLIPAMQSVHKVMPQKLKSGVRVAGRNRVRRGLAVVEIATALILLAGAGLLIKSFYKLMQVDPGFRAKGVLTFELSLPDATYSKPHQATGFYSDLIQRLKARAEVKSAAGVFGLPLAEGYSAGTSFELIGRPAPKDEPTAGLRVITTEYFQTLGIPLLSGRNFLDSDTDQSGDVVIISESVAKAYYPNENPIGQKIDIHVNLAERESQDRTIIGVVGNVRIRDLETNPGQDLYLPHSQQPLNALMVVVRAADDPLNLASAVREEVPKIDSNLPVSNMQTMEEVVGDSLGQRKFTMFLLAAFAAVGLFLAALGTYGVLSFQVVQRTQEIGIRMALGARRVDVLKLVLQEGLFLAVAGTLIGFLGVLGTTRFLESLVYGISTLDAATFASVVILISSVALLACYLPAWRATKVDPITTLHYE